MLNSCTGCIYAHAKAVEDFAYAVCVTIMFGKQMKRLTVDRKR